MALVWRFSVEILEAMQGLNAEGAPGPDGILVFFIKVFWEVVETEVMST